MFPPFIQHIRKILKNRSVDKMIGLTERRSSVALILRQRIDTIPKGYPEHFFQKNYNELELLPQFELLYILRQVRKNDFWSGNVGFPGGMQESNENDKQTVEREVISLMISIY